MTTSADASRPAPMIDGTVAPGWEPVAEAFRHNLESGEDIGAAVAIHHRGQLVVDLRGGSFDGTERPYDDDAPAGFLDHQGHHRDRRRDLSHNAA
jgi:hypothetical protein